MFAIWLVVLSIWLYVQVVKKSPQVPLPPGPKGLPLLANLMDLPRLQPFVTFAKWGEIYGISIPAPSTSGSSDLYAGGIVHINVLGNSIIILNDAKHAIDMLAKKSRIYSDRPTLMMTGRLIGWEDGPALIPLCKTWSEYRRLFAQFMGSRSKVEAFEGVLQGETLAYLQRILADPVAWVEHTKTFVQSP